MTSLCLWKNDFIEFYFIFWCFIWWRIFVVFFVFGEIDALSFRESGTVSGEEGVEEEWGESRCNRREKIAETEKLRSAREHKTIYYNTIIHNKTQNNRIIKQLILLYLY